MKSTPTRYADTIRTPRFGGVAEGEGAMSPCDALAAAWARVAPPPPVGLPRVVHVIPPMPLQRARAVFVGRPTRARAACPEVAPAACACQAPPRRWLRAVLLGGAVFWLGRVSKGRR